jgi:hypothetical protein
MKDIKKMIAGLRRVQKELGTLECDHWECDGFYKPEPKDFITCAKCRVRHTIHIIIEALQRKVKEHDGSKRGITV